MYTKLTKIYIACEISSYTFENLYLIQWCHQNHLYLSKKFKHDWNANVRDIVSIEYSSWQLRTKKFVPNDFENILVE